MKQRQVLQGVLALSSPLLIGLAFVLLLQRQGLAHEFFRSCIVIAHR